MWNSCEGKGMTESGAGGGRQGGTTKLGLGSLVEVSWFCVRGRALCELALFLRERGRETERREGEGVREREMCLCICLDVCVCVWVLVWERLGFGKGKGGVRE